MKRATTANAWHTSTIGAIREELDGSDLGLTEAEAKNRLERYGRNSLPEQPPPQLWQIVLRQFLHPLIYILVAAAGVSLLVGEVKDAVFIAVVLAINAAIGAWQEWKAEQSSLALRKTLKIRATVVRDGEAREIPADEVVQGDVIWLESGNRTPADLRLLSTHDLEIDESLRTGESLPVNKDVSWVGSEEAPLDDGRNMAYAASIPALREGRLSLEIILFHRVGHGGLNDAV